VVDRQTREQINSLDLILLDHRVLNGKSRRHDHVQASLETHQQTFQHPPDVTPEIAGFYSGDNVASAAGTLRSASVHPSTGRKKTAEQETLERSKAFKKAQRSRRHKRAASPCCSVVGA